MTTFADLTICAIVFSTVFRGLVPALSDGALPTQDLYRASTALAIAMAVLGLYWSRTRPSAIPNQLNNILYINLLLLASWCVVDLFLGGNWFDSVYGPTMYSIVPFSVFVFGRLRERSSMMLLAVTTVLLCLTVFFDFALLNTSLIAGGSDLFHHLHSLIRQNGVPWLTHTGNIMRAPGITGNSHDSGNLLAMLGVYWLAKFFQMPDSRVRIFGLFAVAFLALCATGSASNIIAALLGSVAAVIAALSVHRTKAIGPLIMLVILSVFVLIAMEFTPFNLSSGLISQWIERVGPEGDWDTMIKMGRPHDSFLGDLFWIVLGHGDAFGVMFLSEAALVKVLFVFGLVPGLVFTSILAYPLLRFVAMGPVERLRLYPYVAAVGVGLLSMWHYESLFRSTNVFVYFVLYAGAVQSKDSISTRFRKGNLA